MKALLAAGAVMLVVAGSAATNIAPGGFFRVVAPGINNQGPWQALTVTTDANTNTTAITNLNIVIFLA